MLVSGYVAAAGEALARADASWVALDAARLTALPPGAMPCSRAGRTTTCSGSRKAAGSRGGHARRSRGAEAVLDGRLERVAPERTAADAPGSGDVFAATLLVALGRGEDLAARCRGDTGRSRLARVNLALSLLYAAERNPEAEAVVQGETRFTYAALQERVTRLAGGLAAEGLRAGDRLAAVVRPATSPCSSTGRASGSARRSSRSRRGCRRRTSPTAARTRRRTCSSRRTSSSSPGRRLHPGQPGRGRPRKPDALHLRHDRPPEGRPRARTAPTAPAASRRSSTRPTATATALSAACRCTTRWGCTR